MKNTFERVDYLIIIHIYKSVLVLVNGAPTLGIKRALRLMQKLSKSSLLKLLIISEFLP